MRFRKWSCAIGFTRIRMGVYNYFIEKFYDDFILKGSFDEFEI